MESFPDLATETECRELLDRYPDNIFVKFMLARLLRSQGRNDEATWVFPRRSQGRSDEAMDELPLEPHRSLKYDMGLLIEDEHIRQRPNDPVADLSRGRCHHFHGSFGKALSDYDTSITIEPTNANAFCARANLRATCPDKSFRDGQMALEDARTAMKLAEQAGELIGDWRQRRYLQVLAAAHAENNDLQEAIALQARALDLALTKKARSVIKRRLDQYQSGNPIREEIR
jgi:tetratricopeptide (TPR) repeat protein